MTIKILALDISSTTIGVCYDGQPLNTITLRGDDIAKRCLQAATQVRALITDCDLDLVAIESPFVNHQRPNSVIPLARVSGAVLAVLAVAGVAWVEVAPTSVKRALTGKGVAKKPDMIAAAKLATGRDLDEHQADAYGLWLAASRLNVQKEAA